jgi:deoxyribodipyrimidine photo-lyase
MRSLVWFRNDLRVSDNTALHNAFDHADATCAALYVTCPGDYVRHDTSPCRVEFILRTLAVLSADLKKLNIPLLIRVAPTHREVPTIVAQVAREVKADRVLINREYEVNESRRDEAASAMLTRQGTKFASFTDTVALCPSELRTGAGGPYTVFSPYKRAWLKRFEERGGSPVLPSPRKQADLGITGDPVPERVDGFSSEVPAELWPAGEHAAIERLRTFMEHPLSQYKARRDTPSIDGTSAISPYLACGAVSSRTCLALAMEANAGRLDDKGPGGEGAASWVSEIIWREFYKSIVFHFPRVCMGRAFKPETDAIRWNDNPGHLQAWKQGLTGVPIVDAAMRQLAATGWMHNRARMIVAMFLSKDLFLDWRLGEKHFMLSLIDGDLASNNGGWQWSASTGTDAAPYFRIFNPISQSQKFDPDGVYIRRWVPELAGIQGPAIHAPHDEDEGLPPIARMKLEYPAPIVDRSKVRDRVMAAFQGIKPRA